MAIASTGPQNSDYVVPLWLNGEPSTSSSLKTFPVRSANQNNKVVHYAQSADVAAAIQACDSAWEAFQSWKQTSAIHRRDILTRTADILLSRRDELVQAQMSETSAGELWSELNVKMAASHIREIANGITSMIGEIPQTMMDYALCFREPIGPVLSIPPWNAALILAARAICTPLAAGCTVVLKASELSPKSHHLLVQALFDAGLPKDAINVVQVDREDAPAVTEALISHKAIRKVEFIGSAAVGKIIGSLAGKYLKPVLMELGGKCAVIVLEDADLDDAAMKCVFAACSHSGQTCFSTDRVYVVKSVADKFLSLLKSHAQSFDPGTAASTRIAESSIAKLADAERKGAKFILGGPVFKNKETAALQPTIITGVTNNMDIFDEESFGPSLAVHIVDDEEEAVRLVNASAYGLVGAVHTRDMHHGLQIARRLEVGIAHVNGATTYDESTLPLGGSKNSGWGRNNAKWGLEEFSVLKLVTVSMEPGLSKFR